LETWADKESETALRPKFNPFVGAPEKNGCGRKSLMEKRKVVLAGLMLAGVTLTGCQSSDSGPGSRMLSRQSNDAFARPPMNSFTSTMPGNKSLAISDTNTRPGMMPSTNGVQQTSALQNTTSGSAIMPASNSSASGFDQSGSVVSRQMGDANAAPPLGPTPPPPPSNGYSIPTPSAYTPPATSSVPTRKPGDDQ
jgi:hypothetical protein